MGPIACAPPGDPPVTVMRILYSRALRGRRGSSLPHRFVVVPFPLLSLPTHHRPPNIPTLRPAARRRGGALQLGGRDPDPNPNLASIDCARGACVRAPLLPAPSASVSAVGASRARADSFRRSFSPQPRCVSDSALVPCFVQGIICI
jgi:hypothetical protein